MRNLRRLGILTLTLITTVGQVHAFTFNFPPFFGSSSRDNQPPSGVPPWQFRPQDPSNARGMPPGYPMPGGGQGYQQGPAYQPGSGYTPGMGYQPTPGYQQGPGYAVQ